MQLVLGKDVDVWQLVMEPSLTRRAQRIVRDGIERSARACTAVLRPSLAAAAAGTAEPPGAAGAAAANWALAVPAAAAAAAAGAAAATAAAAPRSGAAAAWRGGAAEAAAALESGVHSTLADAAALLPARHGAGVAELAASGVRAKVLSESVHEACAASMGELADEVRKLREMLLAESTPGYGAPSLLAHNFECARCLADHRLCTAASSIGRGGSSSRLLLRHC
jgi:hypothetical protein